MKKEAGKIRFETFKKQDEQESPIDSENSKSPEAAFNRPVFYEQQASFIHTVETMAARRLRNANDPSQDHQFDSGDLRIHPARLCFGLS